MTIEDYKKLKESIISNTTNNKQIKGINTCVSNKCAKCKGMCCSNYPCTMSPNEFLDIEDIDYMKGILDTGVLSITPFSVGSRLYMIRPRGKHDFDTIVTGFAYSPNSCILQGKKGCILDPIVRPTDGLLLMPEEKNGSIYCVNYYSEFKVMDDWQKHQKVLKELIKIYKDKEIDKPLANEETANIYKLRLLGNNCKKETK